MSWGAGKFRSINTVSAAIVSPISPLSVGVFLGWDALRQVLGSQSGDSRAGEGRKLGGISRPSSLALFFISLVI